VLAARSGSGRKGPAARHPRVQQDHQLLNVDRLDQVAIEPGVGRPEAIGRLV